jgi:ABC-type dipeptide/oligopeptide/nickel transport system ATPase subunit
MSPVEITINGKTFKMIFNLKVFRSLGKVWGLDTLDEVVAKVQTIEQLASGSLAAFDTLYDIIHEAINCCVENAEKITRDEIEDLGMEDMTQLANAIAGGTAEGFTLPASDEKKTKPKKQTA